MILFPHGEALRIFEEQREKKKIRSVTVRSILKFSAKTKKKKYLCPKTANLCPPGDRLGQLLPFYSHLISTDIPLPHTTPTPPRPDPASSGLSFRIRRKLVSAIEFSFLNS